MTPLSELAADAAAPSTDLADVTALAERQLALEAEVSRLADALKDAQNRLDAVRRDALPDALRAASMTSLSLASGMTVTLQEDLKVSLPKQRLPGIIDAMRRYGYGARVKNQIVVDLGADSDDAAARVTAAAEAEGLVAEAIETIPTATVKAALKRRLDAGEADDLAFFGAYLFTRTIIR